jgi:probable HAF family extracellular repeat protein
MRTPTFVAPLAVMLASQGVLAQPSYSIAELPAPAAGSNTPKALLDDGRILVVNSDASGNTRSYLWQNGSYTNLGVYQSLGRCEGGAVNSAGRVAGSSWSTSGFPARAWTWLAGVFTAVPTLGGSYANAYDINEGGRVTGWADAPSPASFFAYLFDGTTMLNLGELLGTLSTTGYAVNDAGWVAVAGTSLLNALSRAAVAWAGGGMHDAGSLGGLASFVIDINASGHMCGNSQTGESTSTKYLTHGFIWRDNVMTDIPPLLGRETFGLLDINDLDVAVGNAWTASNVSTAVVVLSDQPWDLNALIPAGSGWVLSQAWCVGNNGQVLGLGTLNGQSKMFIATPTP